MHTCHTTASLLPVIASCPAQTCILVDIDDTVITPVSSTFRTPPGQSLIDSIKKNRGLYPHYEQIISQWRLQRQIMLVDPHWPHILAHLTATYTVWALTQIDSGTCGDIPSMEIWRYQELASLGIHFSENTRFPTAQGIPPSSLEQAAWYRGLLLTGPHSKSEALALYWPYIQATHVVCIDDRVEHVVDVQQWCTERGIGYTGILFTGTQKIPGQPDKGIAAVQAHHLITHQRWLEDPEARRYI